MKRYHGRACAIATGVKLANPALSVWASTGSDTIDYPFNPGELVMGAQGAFFAHTLDCLPPLTTEDTGIHMMLARMKGDLPVAIGVIRNVKKTSYTQLYEDQMEEQMTNGKYKCMDDLLNSGDTWEI